MNNKEWSRQITESAEMGVAMVGKRKALGAAIRTQHQLLADLFKLTHGVVVAERAKGKDLPILPMTDEVIELLNNCLSGSQMVAVLMSMGCLDEEVREDDITYGIDHSASKSGVVKHRIPWRSRPQSRRCETLNKTTDV